MTKGILTVFFLRCGVHADMYKVSPKSGAMFYCLQFVSLKTVVRLAPYLAQINVTSFLM